MCRFLVYWGEKPVQFSHWLVEAENSLVKQSECDVSNRPNPDGWGLVGRRDNKFTVVKNTEPAYQDQKFITEASKLHGDLLFAHIRRRSQGPVLMENTHPFVYKNWIFMHNGNIPDFEQCKLELNNHLPRNMNIKTEGSTDSEYLFKYFLHWFENSKKCDVYCILNIIYNIIHKIVKTTPAEKQELLALNFVFTDGKYLIGFRRNRSLFYTQPEDGLLISSEPVDKEYNWNEIPENHFILCHNPHEIKIAAYDIELSRREMGFV